MLPEPAGPVFFARDLDTLAGAVGVFMEQEDIMPADVDLILRRAKLDPEEFWDRLRD